METGNLDLFDRAFAELRIYQNDEVYVLSSEDESEEGENLRADILTIMGRTQHFDNIITQRRKEALG